MSRNVARKMGLLSAMLVLSAYSSAGVLSFTPGSWSNLTGTASTNSALYETSSTLPAGSLAVKVIATGSQTLRGTWSFTVGWKPTTVGETPPANVKVLLKRSATPMVAGNGVAKVEAISGTPPTTTELLKVDSGCLILSGRTKYLADVEVTIPLVLQSNGSYVANGSVTSDLLTATYNSQSSAVTAVKETFTVGGLEGAN